MGTSLLIGILATKEQNKKMKTFIVFLGLLGAALSLPERDLDRNIFDDAWNGIQDTANSIQDAVSGAKFAALLVDCNSPLRHTAMDFKGDFIDDLKQMKDKEEVFPHFGDAINHFGDQLGQMAKNLDDLSTCMKGSWFGRTYEQTSSLKEAATSPPAANRLDIMAMITKAIDIGKFGVSVVGKLSIVVERLQPLLLTRRLTKSFMICNLCLHLMYSNLTSKISMEWPQILRMQVAT